MFYTGHRLPESQIRYVKKNVLLTRAICCIILLFHYLILRICRRSCRPLSPWSLSDVTIQIYCYSSSLSERYTVASRKYASKLFLFSLVLTAASKVEVVREVTFLVSTLQVDVFLWIQGSFIIVCWFPVCRYRVKLGGKYAAQIEFLFNNRRESEWVSTAHVSPYTKDFHKRLGRKPCGRSLTFVWWHSLLWWQVLHSQPIHILSLPPKLKFPMHSARIDQMIYSSCTSSPPSLKYPLPSSPEK